MKYGYQKTTDSTFENVDEKLRNALIYVGFGIITEIDIQKTFKEKLGIWANAFSSQNCNKNGKLERKQNFSKPRTEGRSTRRRKLQ